MDGELIELFRETASPDLAQFPTERVVNLAEWAGQDLEVLLRVDGPEGTGIGWAAPAVYSRGAVSRREAGDRPNVLLIAADTLRVDYVGAYGLEPGVSASDVSLTPALDRLAAESDVWLDAFSAFNSTNPSFASLFTGLWGKNHNVYDLHTPLPSEHTTLTELFDEAGYDTLAVISARHLGDHNSGLGQGFDEIVQAREHNTAQLAVDATMNWIAEREHPFFVWLHLFDTHTPHTAPEPYASGQRPGGLAGLGPVESWVDFREPGPVIYDQPVLAGHSELYAAEVSYLDRQIDRLLDDLRGRGLMENTIIAFTADHGENLGEHRLLYRHIGLWRTTTHVPLMIRWPGAERQGRRIEGLVQSFDLYPTLGRRGRTPGAGPGRSRSAQDRGWRRAAAPGGLRGDALPLRRDGAGPGVGAMAGRRSPSDRGRPIPLRPAPRSGRGGESRRNRQPG